MVAYLPLLLTRAGMVGADTKQYLYLDPARLLATAPSLWDPNVGMGTVTHQTIGYLMPMGPFYWFLHALGSPTWVAQRIWTGSLLFFAGLGVVFLLRTLGNGEIAGEGRRRSWHPLAILVAALAFMLSPYVLQYEARISAILMPWSALPWLVALVVRGLRAGGWRHPALFALVVTLIGGVNATSLVYAGIAPLLWIPFAVWVHREATLSRAVGVLLRTGALTLVTALWWIAGLSDQGGYGLNVLRYTETVQVVSQTGLAFEALRGLGNWFFYGRDAIGPWVQSAVDYTRHLWLLAVSYAVPTLAFVGAAITRWRHRLYFVTLVVVGVVLAVGVHPYAHPTPFGSVLKTFTNGSTAGLALRSVGRAVPLVALGTSVLLAAGVEAMLGWRPRWGTVAAGVAVVLVVADMAPLWTGEFVDRNLERPEQIPPYWLAAARALDAGGDATRVLEEPGADFSHYRWGATLDPVTPGLMDRPFVGRELIPYGSAASADLLIALDRRLQEGIFEPESLAPLARLMSAGDVLLRSDLQYERFRTPRPRPTWAAFNPAPAGLGPPTTFGPPVPSTTVRPLLDEITLATPPGAPDPPAVAIFPVPGARPIVRAEPVGRPLVVAGSGDGLVDAAAAGILGTGPDPVLYAAALDQQPGGWQQALAAGADLVLTDTNRRRAQDWGSIRENTGYTEQSGETPLVADPNDNRLPLFPRAGDGALTLTQPRGVASVRATHYGNPVTYIPSQRPDLALDGDPSTAWEVGAFSEVIGERLRIDLQTPVTTDRVTLVQPLTGPTDRFITRATLHFDVGPDVPVSLGPASRTVGGQPIRFPRRTFRRLEIVIDATNVGRRADYQGTSAVGFAEVRMGGSAPVGVDEVVRLPTDLLAAAGSASIDHRLVVVMTRLRSDPAEAYKSDEEQAVVRTFSLPAGRSFALEGTARLSALAPDGVIDALLGGAGTATPVLTGPGGGGDQIVDVTSSGRLPGDLSARAQSAFDGDSSTFWSPGLGDQRGQWLRVKLAHPLTVNHLVLTVVADGRHSVPTRLRVAANGGPAEVVDVPPVLATVGQENGTVTIPVPLPAPVHGDDLQLSIDAVRPAQTINYFSSLPQTLPVGLAEVTIPGAYLPPRAPTFAGPCREDLLTVDGHPVGVRLVGEATMAAARQALRVEGCGGPLALGPGSHDVRARPGRETGVDLDRLVLSSERGGAALPFDPSVGLNPDPAPGRQSDRPTVTAVSHSRTSWKLRVTGTTSGQAFWLVLGQSFNTGWTASSRGHSLGRPRLIDGYANGWLIQPPASGVTGSGPLTVTLRWTPQQRIWIALGLSGVGVLVCLALAVWGGGAGPGPERPSEREAGPERPSEREAGPVHPALIGVGWLRGAGPPRLRRTIALTAWSVLAAGSGLLVGPPAAAVVGLLAGIGLVWPRLRPLLALVAAGGVAVSGLYVVQLQARYGFPLRIEWAQQFSRVAGLSFVAVALLAADALIAHLESRPESGVRAGPGPGP